MFKTLLKKQFLELNSFYFQDKKTGKMRSKKSTVIYVLLFALLFIGLGVAFYEMSKLFAPLLYTPASWLYFCLMGMMAIIMGVFGSVFNTYAGLYHAKDNDLLLSMPIPPSKILLVRIVGVMLMSLLYEGMVIIPVIIARFTQAPITPLAATFTILLALVIAFLVTALSCLLGWVVALLSAKFKNKSIVTALFSLVFIAAYYYVCMRAYEFIQMLILNSEAVGNGIKSWGYPFYLMGTAAEGDVKAMVIFTLMVAALFALTYFILSKSFIKIATKKTAGVKKEYKERTVKAESLDKALFRKEWKRFTSSATYMLNCGLGTVFMIAAAVALLIYCDDIRSFALPMLAGYEDYFAPAAAAMLMLISSMNNTTAPSISLEGKSLWIYQSMPAPAQKIFMAKQKVDWVITIPPAMLLALSFIYVLKIDIYSAVMLLIFSGAYIMLTSAAGVAINLKKPNLTWTNETVPIKQSVGVMLVLFGGWLLAILYGVVGYYAVKHIGGMEYLTVVTVIILVFARMLNGWLTRKGVKLFRDL